MKKVFLIAVLMYSLLLIITSQQFKDYTTTFVRQWCQNVIDAMMTIDVSRPEILGVDNITLSQYSRMEKLSLENLGGYDLIYCDGFNFPDGLKVGLSGDGHSCVITGIPLNAQVRTDAYVVAANHNGRSLAVVPVEVNALLLRE